MPRFRWYLEGTSEGDLLKLVLNPGPSEVEVKTWELEDSFLGTWHHVAFTLRMARQYTSTSDKPELVVTQAFCFLDGKPLTDTGTFVKLDYPGELHKQLVFRSGLSSALPVNGIVVFSISFFCVMLSWYWGHAQKSESFAGSLTSVPKVPEIVVLSLLPGP